MRCNHCGFEILDESPVCPFCKMALRQEKRERPEQREEPEYVMEEGTNEGGSRRSRRKRAGKKAESKRKRAEKKRRSIKHTETEVFGAYPEIKEQFRRKRRILAAVLFFVIMVESILVLINVFTYETVHYPWSVLIGGILLFSFLCLWNVFRTRVGHIAKIYTQMGLFLLLLLFLDKMLNKHGVFIGYGLPILIDCFLGVILFCMIVNRAHYENYVLLQFFMVVFSGITLLLMVTGVLKNQKLISTSLVAAALFFLGTVMLGHRKVRQELKRKFHV